jgi:hypothetical protein
MRSKSTVRLFGLFILLACVTNAQADVLASDGTYGGRTYNEWHVLFNQTLLTLPVVNGKHPYLTGEAFEGDQRMLFLLNFPRVDITIPHETALFFPLTNFECSILEPPPCHGDDEDSLRACANGKSDRAFASGQSASIDGVPVENLDSYRFETPLFEFGPLPEDNLFQFFDIDAPAGTTSLSVSDGIFLLVTPLSVGRHTIRFNVPNNGINSTFRITVAPMPGDFDLDGSLTALDIDQLSAEIRGGGTNVSFDLNGDSRIDTADRATWVHDLRKTYFGDANLDGQFNSTDMIAVFQAGKYEDMVSTNSGWMSGDWDGDGDFTTGDLVAAFQDGGYENGPRPTLATVPEPSACFLLMFGLLGCWLCRPELRSGPPSRFRLSSVDRKRFPCNRD